LFDPSGRDVDPVLFGGMSSVWHPDSLLIENSLFSACRYDLYGMESMSGRRGR
jgi:hypothetical protein